MLEYAYDLSGCATPVIAEFDIAAATACSKGEAVRVTDGYVVTGGTDYTTGYTGVTLSAKAANDGTTRIKCYVSPTAVFAVAPIATTVSATPSGTVWTDSVVLLNTTNDTSNGGKLKIKSKAAAATGTYTVGQIIKVTDSTTNTLTGVFAGNTTVGDVALFFPPINALGATLSATNGLTITWAATTGTAIKVVDHDFVNNKVLVMFKIHSFAN